MKNSRIDIEDLVAKANELPPLSPSSARLSTLVADRDRDIADVVEVIQYDPMLTARLILLANSALHAAPVPITSVGDAVLRLGMAQVATLAVASSVRPLLTRALPTYGLNERALWEHLVSSAVAAEVLPGFCPVIPEESFTAALLHDVGKLVLDQAVPRDQTKEFRSAETKGGVERVHLEYLSLGIHHGEIGGIVAKRWKLPAKTARAIVHHHTPDDINDLICDAVHLANAVAHANYANPNNPEVENTISPGAVDRLRFDMGKWTELCQAAQERYSVLMESYH